MKSCHVTIPNSLRLRKRNNEKPKGNYILTLQHCKMSLLFCVDLATFLFTTQNWYAQHCGSFSKSSFCEFHSFTLKHARQQTDVNLGDKRVTRGSFHLGCCTGVSCGPPLHVANGVVRGAVFQFGDVAVYSCFGGYAMEGVGRSRCLENGTWTLPPTCRGRENTPSVFDRRGLSPFFPGHFLLPLTLLFCTWYSTAPKLFLNSSLDCSYSLRTNFSGGY